MFWKGGGFSLCNDIDLNLHPSEIYAPQNLSQFIARIPRRLYVNYDSIKFELRVFSQYGVPLTFYIYENH